MQKLLLCFFFLGCIHFSFAQSVVKGKVADTLNKKPLENAVVSLLRKADSTLYKFLRTNKDGEFQMSNINNGKYLLLVTYPKFVDYTDEIEITNSEKNLGSIPLTLQSQLLNEVVIRQNLSIRMKGDTIEYKADSFKVAEGASVKDLLRKLPGLQIDKNGQITAQGEKVEKVLVDGEEFFSDDPAVVIENLRADAVDKVQSFDKKSDQAEFTGVDDGNKSKTLNLVLKEDKKKGYLGKIVIGGGTYERYSSQAMLNYFKGKKKISIYGIGTNTGQTGLGWNDRNKFGEGNDFGDAEIEMGAGYIMISSSGNDNEFNDFENSYRGEGIPRSIKAGAHFSNKWNGDKQGINGNYSIRDIKVNAAGNSFTKFLLPDTSYYSREDHISNNTQRQQMFNGTYDIKFDSLSSLRVKVNGKIENSNNYTSTGSETLDEDQVTVNRNSRINTANSENKTFAGSALWRQKFRKKGRTLSLSASYKNADRDSKGYLNSGTDFFVNGIPVRTDSTNQYKTSTGTTSTINSKLVYTEAAGKKGILEFNYTLSNITSNSNRKSFDRVGGKYEALNPLFSNKYQLNYTANSAGAKYQYNSKKFIANIGTNAGVSRYIQKDSLGRQVRQLNFTNLFPTSRLTYRFSSQRGLSLNYSGTPESPTIEQVQPIRENTNPLFITLGNPSLQQAFRHNISVSFNDFKTLTGRSIFLSGSVTPVHNAIVNSQKIDSGITRQQYVNASGNYSYYLYGSYSARLGKKDFYLGFNANVNGSQYVNFVNDQRNVSNQTAIRPGISVQYYKQEKIEFFLETGFGYNVSKSNGNNIKQASGDKTHYWTQDHSGSLVVYLNKQLSIGTNADFTFSQKTNAFTSDVFFTVWNANLSYKLFKKRNGIFRFEINDLLKQRTGYQRNTFSNQISEKNYNTLGRYAMLSFTWNFTKTPGTPEQSK